MRRRSVGPAFFLEEGVDIIPVGTQTAAAGRGERETGVERRSGHRAGGVGRPRSTTRRWSRRSAARTPTRRTRRRRSSRSRRDPGANDRCQDVLIAEGPGYRRVTTSKARAPSPGPKPTSGGATSGGDASGGPDALAEQLQALLDEVLADGAAQADADALLAAVPQGDATEGLEVDVPDVPPPDDPESLDLPPEELA